MKLIPRIFVVFGLLLFTVQSAGAWSVVVSDNFSRANTSPGTVGNSWTDTSGSTFSISSNTLLGSTSNTAGFTSIYLTRPIGETLIDSRITSTFTLNAATSANVGLGLRKLAGANGYYLGVFGVGAGGGSIGGLAIYKVVAGSATSLYAGSNIPPVNGHNYTFDFSVTGTSPTTITGTITDNTTSTVVATQTITDSEATLQTTGVQLVTIWTQSGTTSVNYSNVTTYANVAGSISLSPSSVVANTSGNVITVTGTATAFSGSPFTTTGGIGSYQSAQSVSSGTSGTVTINPGLAGQGNLTVTDAGGGGNATLTINPPSSGTLKIGWIGDSITAGTNGAPVTQAVSYLTNIAGYTVTSSNRGINATSSSDWISGSTDLNNAKTAFAGAGVTIIHYMLGTNDTRAPNNFSPATHHANVVSTVNDLVAAGYSVIISKPPMIYPNTSPGATQWSADPNGTLQAYWLLDSQLANGTNIFIGDQGYFAYSLNNPTTWTADGVHPKDATQNNILGNDWGVAIQNRFGNAMGVLAGGY